MATITRIDVNARWDWIDTMMVMILIVMMIFVAIAITLGTFIDLIRIALLRSVRIFTGRISDEISKVDSKVIETKRKEKNSSISFTDDNNF